MGRTKPPPKRRCLEAEEAERQALETLKNAPIDDVEWAAAEATRSAIVSWPSVEGEEVLPPFLEGLGVARCMPEHHYRALQGLQESILERSKNCQSSWSGVVTDPRRRAFGILPNTLGAAPNVRNQLDISMPWTGDSDSAEERTRNRKATVLLQDDELAPGTKEAIDWLCESFAPALPDASLRPHLHYDNLIVAQPNLHNGRHLLPIHVDHPQKDGFGVLIVTIAIHGRAQILFQDSTHRQRRKMELAPGQAYMIAGPVRDACAHGVLAAADDGRRQSLNLRFGLHDWEDPKGTVAISSQTVLRHWEWNEHETAEPNGHDRATKRQKVKRMQGG